MQHLDEILQAMQQTDAIKYTKDKALEASQQAIDALAPIAESEYKQALITLAQIAVERAA